MFVNMRYELNCDNICVDMRSFVSNSDEKKHGCSGGDMCRNEMIPVSTSGDRRRIDCLHEVP